MKGPSNVECAKAEGIERRNFVSSPSGFNCPFCNKRTAHSALKKATGHRCTCGALYSTRQTIAQHYKRKGN